MDFSPLLPFRSLGAARLAMNHRQEPVPAVAVAPIEQDGGRFRKAGSHLGGLSAVVEASGAARIVLALARLGRARAGIGASGAKLALHAWPVGWIASSLPPSLVELCRICRFSQ